MKSLHYSLIISRNRKATDDGLLEIELFDLRRFAKDKHRTVDDTPFGGGGGMVLKIEPIDNCLASLGYKHKKKAASKTGSRILLTSAAGETFTQRKAIEYSCCQRLTIICGHYLGVDERLLELYDIDEISIGDYVLTGGEPAAAVVVDAVARLLPKVLGNFGSALDDSFMDQITGTPVYTKPAEYEGLSVPAELLSGNHQELKKFREKEAIRKCSKNRPDLLRNSEIAEKDLEVLKVERSEK